MEVGFDQLLIAEVEAGPLPPIRAPFANSDGKSIGRERFPGRQRRQSKPAGRRVPRVRCAGRSWREWAGCCADVPRKGREYRSPVPWWGNSTGSGSFPDLKSAFPLLALLRRPPLPYGAGMKSSQDRGALAVKSAVIGIGFPPRELGLQQVQMARAHRIGSRRLAVARDPPQHRPINLNCAFLPLRVTMVRMLPRNTFTIARISASA